jgi:hypothetical protein
VTCAGLFNPGRAPFIYSMGHDISLKLVGHATYRHPYLRSAKNTVVEKINMLNPCR